MYSTTNVTYIYHTNITQCRGYILQLTRLRPLTFHLDGANITRTPPPLPTPSISTQTLVTGIHSVRMGFHLISLSRRVAGDQAGPCTGKQKENWARGRHLQAGRPPGRRSSSHIDTRSVWSHLTRHQYLGRPANTSADPTVYPNMTLGYLSGLGGVISPEGRCSRAGHPTRL